MSSKKSTDSLAIRDDDGRRAQREIIVKRLAEYYDDLFAASRFF